MKIIKINTDRLIETRRTMEEQEAIFLAAVCAREDNCCHLYYLVKSE